jgi:hypothetical protein
MLAWGFDGRRASVLMCMLVTNPIGVRTGKEGSLVLKSIDHVVVAVRDLDLAAADYAEAGFTVSPGGEHFSGATHNALVSFADGSYLELLAIKDPAKAAGHPWFAALDAGDGAAAFALLASDLPAEATRATAAGLIASEVRDGGRTRPDGQAVAWRSFTLAGTSPLLLPFVIEDVTPRELRVPGGAATEHRIGATGVRGMTIVVADMAPASEAYAALLGTGTEFDVGRFAGIQARTRFALGEQWIDLVEPDELGSERFPRAGIARIELSGGSREQPVDVPAALTHRLSIRLDG